MNLRWLAVCLVFVAILLPGAASACEDGHHPFASDMADKPHLATVQSGTLVLKPRKGRDAFIAESTQVTPTIGHDIDICVTMTFEHVGQPDNDTGGVAFWSVDADNYYYFGLTPNGLGYIEQRINSTTHVLVDFRPVLGANIGQGASNHIEITTIGKTAVVYVNDKEFDRIEGQPPGNIQMMLLAVASTAKAPITTFDDLSAQATTVLSLGDNQPSDQAKAGGCEGVAYLDDPFDKWDGRWWGKTYPETTIVDGHLIFVPAPGHEFRLWTDTGEGDRDLCSIVSVTSDKGQAGLLFWLKSDGDYEALVISKDGHASVEQSVGNDWTQILAPVPIITNPSGNRLKVSIRGERAEVYVNGTDIGSVTAPANAGRQVGMLVAMQDGIPVQGSFDDMVVAKPPAATLMAKGDVDKSVGTDQSVKGDELYALHFDSADGYLFTGGGQGVENGQLVQRLKGDASIFFRVDQAPRDADASVKMTFADGASDGSVFGGMFFWRRSPSDYFGLQISPDGWASVVHVNGDKEEDVVKDQPLPALHDGKGAENILRVVTVGDRAALFINGTRFGDIALEQPTTDLLQSGVYSDSKAAAEIRFDDLVGKRPDVGFAFQPPRNDHGDPSSDFFDALDKMFNDMGDKAKTAEPQTAEPQTAQPPSAAPGTAAPKADQSGPGAPGAAATNGPSSGVAK